MKKFSENFFRTVGVCFDPLGVSLAVRRGRRVDPLVRLALAADASSSARADDYRDSLSELVVQQKVSGARCVASLATARCRVQWASLTGARLRDLRTAVGQSAFWQAHLGVTLESHCVWWRFVRDGDGRRIHALLVAAAREDVDFYADTIRAAGLAVGVIGVSCFDYFDQEFAPDTSRVTLVLDCDDACVVSTGAFGLRAHAAEFDRRAATALVSGELSSQDAVVDGLAACVRRCIDNEQAATRLHAHVRVVAARGLHGEWFEVLRARLPGFPVEFIDGWDAAGLAAADGNPRGGSHDDWWRLPRAAACLIRDGQPVVRLLRRTPATAVNLARGRADGARRYPAYALAVAVCLFGAALVYAHWLLLDQRRLLQSDAQRHLQLSTLRDRMRAEVEDLRDQLSNRISFYSGIQRISFERKLMPRLLALVEHAAFEGVWLNTVHFRQPGSLRITGKSLSDKQIAHFIQRLRTADEITAVFLESAALEKRRDKTSDFGRRLKNFVITCHVQAPGEDR